MPIYRGMSPSGVVSREGESESDQIQFRKRMISLCKSWSAKGILTPDAADAAESLFDAHMDLCEEPANERSAQLFESSLEEFMDYVDDLGTEEDEDASMSDDGAPFVEYAKGDIEFRFYKGRDDALDEAWTGGFFEGWVGDFRRASPDSYDRLLEICRRRWKRAKKAHLEVPGTSREIDLAKATRAYMGTQYLVSAMQSDSQGLLAAFAKWDLTANERQEEVENSIDWDWFGHQELD